MWHNMLGVEVLIYSDMPTCLVLKFSGEDNKYFEADWIAKNMATAWVKISLLTINSKSKSEVPETWNVMSKYILVCCSV